MKTTLVVPTLVGIALAMGIGLSTALAAPVGMPAPATRSLAPARAPGAAVVPTPTALRPDLVVDGNGVHFGGRFATFGTTAGIVSTVIAQLPPVQQEREREPSCSFIGSFTIRNAGGGPAGAVDVYTWFEQPQGPQVGKISDQGYGNPALAPGGSQTWSLGFTLKQGSYVFHLVIDPKHLNKQYALNLKASCTQRGAPLLHAPAAPAPAPAGFSSAPSGGIGIRSAGAHWFMQVQGVAGESSNLAHQGWIELLNASSRNEGPDGSRNGCQQIRFAATKLVDKSSAQLMALSNSGRSTTITLDGPGGRRTLQRAMITSLSQGGGGGNRPQESLSVLGSYCP